MHHTPDNTLRKLQAQKQMFRIEPDMKITQLNPPSHTVIYPESEYEGESRLYTAILLLLINTGMSR